MDSPLRICNTTLHEPTDPQRAAGVGPPRGRDVPSDASFADIREMARSLLDRAERDGAEAVLVGGLSSVAVAVHEAATDRGLGVVEAVTERRQDEGDWFVFHHLGFRVLAEPSPEVCVRERWRRWCDEYSRPVEDDV